MLPYKASTTQKALQFSLIPILYFKDNPIYGSWCFAHFFSFGNLRTLLFLKLQFAFNVTLYWLQVYSLIARQSCTLYIASPNISSAHLAPYVAVTPNISSAHLAPYVAVTVLLCSLCYTLHPHDCFVTTSLCFSIHHLFHLAPNPNPSGIHQSVRTLLLEGFTGIK